ncbi:MULTISPECIES: hypothetical protein [unclassified Variovorax]|uniref:hypothetical protein n=1 Tax=unclassified Variovorax TaxID=663243 RepID=UPI003F45F73C
MSAKVYRANPRDHDAVAKALLEKLHDQQAAAEVRRKPVKLQLNNSGAWKDVIHFDAVNDVSSEHVLDAANTLGNLDAHRVTFRVVTEGQLPEVLMTWNKADGWKKARGQA